MTKAEVIAVARYYADNISKADSPSVFHLSTMLAQMEQMTDVEKLMRWLGFMQGVLYAEGLFTIDELRHHNKYGVARYLDQLQDKLARLDGKPPYNTPGNFCYADGYFALSIEKDFGAPIAELRKLVRDAH